MTTRYHYLDSMRSVLMLLGVFIHSANIYAVSGGWLVTDTHSSVAFDYLVEFIHVFRMPAFFIVSGFFSLFVLMKYGTEKFFQTRTKRLLVPFFSTLVLLNILEGYVVYNHRQAQQLGFVDFLLSNEGFAGSISDGEWVSHLWFLSYLFIYVSVCTLWCKSKVLRDLFKRKYLLGFLDSLLAEGRYLLVLPALPLFFLALAKLSPAIFYTKLFGFFSLIGLLKYLPFFLYGLWLFRDESNLEEFTKLRKWHIVAFCLSLVLLTINLKPAGIVLDKSIHTYAYGVVSWFCCTLCFVFFRRFFSEKSKCFAYLSEASYSVYLFHHILVVIIGISLVGLNVSIYLKYLVVVGVVISAVLILHDRLILRYKLFRYLFNGK